MRWPWRRPAEQVPPSESRERPRGAWRSLAPLETTAGTPLTTAAEPAEFVRTLATRWQVPPALGSLGHRLHPDAPAARVPLDVAAPRPGYGDAPALLWPVPPVAAPDHRDHGMPTAKAAGGQSRSPDSLGRPTARSRPDEPATHDPTASRAAVRGDAAPAPDGASSGRPELGSSTSGPTSPEGPAVTDLGASDRGPANHAPDRSGAASPARPGPVWAPPTAPPTAPRRVSPSAKSTEPTTATTTPQTTGQATEPDGDSGAGDVRPHRRDTDQPAPVARTRSVRSTWQDAPLVSSRRGRPSGSPTPRAAAPGPLTSEPSDLGARPDASEDRDAPPSAVPAWFSSGSQVRRPVDLPADRSAGHPRSGLAEPSVPGSPAPSLPAVAGPRRVVWPASLPAESSTGGTQPDDDPPPDPASLRPSRVPSAIVDTTDQDRRHDDPTGPRGNEVATTGDRSTSGRPIRPIDPAEPVEHVEHVEPDRVPALRPQPPEPGSELEDHGRPEPSSPSSDHGWPGPSQTPSPTTARRPEFGPEMRTSRPPGDAGPDRSDPPDLPPVQRGFRIGAPRRSGERGGEPPAVRGLAAFAAAVGAAHLLQPAEGFGPADHHGPDGGSDFVGPPWPDATSPVPEQFWPEADPFTEPDPDSSSAAAEADAVDQLRTSEEDPWSGAAATDVMPPQVYEQVLSRLRHDLLVDRERSASLTE